MKWADSPGKLLAVTVGPDRPGNPYTTTSSTVVPIDATNLAVTFAVPPSGIVLVRLQGFTANDTNGRSHKWQLLDTSNAAASNPRRVALTNGTQITAHATFRITGLTGTTKTLRWGWLGGDAAGTINLYSESSDFGLTLMEVYAA